MGTERVDASLAGPCWTRTSGSSLPPPPVHCLTLFQKPDREDSSGRGVFVRIPSLATPFTPDVCMCRAFRVPEKHCSLEPYVNSISEMGFHAAPLLEGESAMTTLNPLSLSQAPAPFERSRPIETGFQHFVGASSGETGEERFSKSTFVFY